MNRLRGLVGSTQASSANASTTSLSRADEELANMQDAMLSASHIMEDDMEAATSNLEKNNSSYHILGRGIITFLRAIIGSEQVYLKEASQLLAQAESISGEARKNAEKDPNTYRSEIYPPGTEHALCVAMAQIMSAAVAVMNENVVEALKGFYKMRKAYNTLQAIAAIEREYLKSNSHNEAPEKTSVAKDSHPTLMPGKGLPHDGQESGDEDDFFDADQETTQQANAHYLGRLETENERSSREPAGPTNDSVENLWAETSVNDNQKTKALITHPLDIFVQSGTCLYLGIILLMLSMIPPSFAKLLSYIGFRGDRKRGLDLLWRASSVRTDINGSIAALILTGFYDGAIANLDILPQSAYPKDRITNIIKEMSQVYPNSRLWFLQKVRSVSAEKDLERSTRMIEDVESTECKLRQVEALQWFEKSLNLLAIHDFPSCSASFERCVEVNNWSHGFYYYASACCHVELYRIHSAAKGPIPPPAFSGRLRAIKPDAKLAAKHAEAATTILLEKVPKYMGKKKLIGRQLPLDTFVLRKLAKWKARADQLGCQFIDAIGVSPYEEMVFFWGGHGRMNSDHLHDSLVRLAWSDGGDGDLHLATLPDAPLLPEIDPSALASCADADERATLAVLRAITYRNLKQPDLAYAVLNRENLVTAKTTSHRLHQHAENWPAPMARYELAVAAWIAAGGMTGADAAAAAAAASPEHADITVGPTHGLAGAKVKYDREKLMECSRLLEEVAAWDSFDLETRFGIKISTGRETLRSLGIVNGKAR